VLPLKLEAKDINKGPLDMRVTSRMPCCNIAVAESPFNAFVSTSLALNGKIFAEQNEYRKILDCCYQGTGPSSYGDNHSLKPVVCRNLVGRDDEKIYVMDDQKDPPIAVVPARFIVSKNLEHFSAKSAFSLLENNGPFLERARTFQDKLSSNGQVWTGEITNYLELGPFQARGRTGNTQIPYIRDFHLRLNFATNPSAWDNLYGVSNIFSAGQTISNSRSVPCKLFEFGTPSTLQHVGDIEPSNPGNYITSFDCTWTAKPYLEVTYTRFLDTMKASYNLRCFERQYEKSQRFTLVPDVATRKAVAPVVSRVTSRLLSMPTKIYLYSELADTFRGSFMLGGVRRSCALTNIHCRLNNRPDIIFDPSPEHCFELFQRHTNSSLEYGAWLKSPIYVFTPVDLQQSDFFSNDARLTVMEWDATVDLTPLQHQEMSDANTPDYMERAGYERKSTIYKYIQHDSIENWSLEWDVSQSDALNVGDTACGLILYDQGNQIRTGPGLDVNNAYLRNKLVTPRETIRYAGGLPSPSPMQEKIRITQVQPVSCRFYGFLWGQLHVEGGSIGHFEGELIYVPKSHLFEKPNNHCINPFSIIGILPKDASDLTQGYKYHVNGGAAAVPNVNIMQATFAESDRSSKKIFTGKKTIFNVPQAGQNPGGVYCPGLYGIMSDSRGLNTDIGDGSNGVFGFQAEGETNFPCIDLRSPSTLRWVCINCTDAMIAGTNGYDYLKCRTAQIPVPGLFNTAFAKDDKLVMWGHGKVGQINNCTAVARGVGPHGVSVADVPMQVPAPDGTIIGNHQGFMFSEVVENAGGDKAFEYQMKVLYEYGNANYQFTNDGMPTRVLPNLVPVQDSRDIPVLQ